MNEQRETQVSLRNFSSFGDLPIAPQQQSDGIKWNEVNAMKVDLKEVEEACKELYIRALKILPPDIKQGFARLDATETDATGKAILGTMIRNIAVAGAQSEPAVPGHGNPDL